MYEARSQVATLTHYAIPLASLFSSPFYSLDFQTTGEESPFEKGWDVCSNKYLENPNEPLENYQFLAS